MDSRIKDPPQALGTQITLTAPDDAWLAAKKKGSVVPKEYHNPEIRHTGGASFIKKGTCK